MLRKATSMRKMLILLVVFALVLSSVTMLVGATDGEAGETDLQEGVQPGEDPLDENPEDGEEPSEPNEGPPEENPDPPTEDEEYPAGAEVDAPQADAEMGRFAATSFPLFQPTASPVADETGWQGEFAGLSDGDTVVVELTGDLTVDAMALIAANNVDVTVRGESGPVTVTAAGSRHFNITGSDVTLRFEDVTLDGGGAYGGINIASGASATIEGVVIQNCKAASGGGIDIAVADVVLNHVTITSSESTSSGGGGLHIDLPVRGATNTASLTLNDCVISGNRATGSSNWGGGIRATGFVDLVINDCVITDNVAVGNGGGIYFTNCGTLVVNGGVIADNKALHGGGLYAGGIEITLSGSAVLRGNEARGYGGGIFAMSSSISNNYTPTELIIQDTASISGNSAANIGGGVYSQYDYMRMIPNQITLTNSASIGGNTASYGGGIGTYGDDIAVRDDACITDNSATNDGGGIYLGAMDDGNGEILKMGTLELADRARIADNKADLDGGGIFTEDYNALTAEKGVTFSGNTARAGYWMSDAAMIALHDALIETDAFSVSPTGQTFRYGYNNYDVNYEDDGGKPPEEEEKEDPNPGPGGGPNTGEGNGGESVGSGGSSGSGSGFSPGLTAIPDDDVPLGLVEIEEEDVPLGALPKTGSSAVHAQALFAVLATSCGLRAARRLTVRR